MAFFSWQNAITKLVFGENKTLPRKKKESNDSVPFCHSLRPKINNFRQTDKRTTSPYSGRSRGDLIRKVGHGGVKFGKARLMNDGRALAEEQTPGSKGKYLGRGRRSIQTPLRPPLPPVPSSRGVFCWLQFGVSFIPCFSVGCHTTPLATQWRSVGRSVARDS